MFNDEVIIKSQQRFRSDHHKVYTEKVSKIALSSNDDKRIKTLDRGTTFPYGMDILKMCENEMLLKNKFSNKLNSESQVLRNKSQELINEAKSLRNESQELRNELKELRNKSQELRNKSQALRNEAQVLKNEAQIHKNKSWILRSKSQVLREKSQNLRSEAHAIKHESFLARSKSENLRSEAEGIRNRSDVLRLETQALRNILFKSDEEKCMHLIERIFTFNDLEDDLDTTSLFKGLETDSSFDEEDVIDGNKERPTHLDKTNELINQVNLLVKTRNNFSKNVNEICMLMNELQDEIYDDDSWLRLVELNKINALLTESLDYVWKMIYAENREKHEITNIDIVKDNDIDGHVSMYTDIINDKLKLVNRIGKLLDSIMFEVQNVVDMVRETDNDSLIYDILAENLKKWKDDILELINSVNVCAKPDIKKKDDTKKKDKPNTSEKNDKTNTSENKDKPNTSEKKDKPNTSEKKDKPNTSEKKDKSNASEKKDKPNTSEKKDKPNTSEKKDKPNTSEKKDKPNTSDKKDKSNTSEKKNKPNTSEKNDKPNTSEKKDDNIKKYNKPSKSLDSIEKIIKRFMCEKFMDKKYYVKTGKYKIVF